MTEFKITILGAGAIGTALAQAITQSDDRRVVLLSIEQNVVDSINQNRINNKYFPTIKLNRNISATTNPDVLQQADLIFMAIPSTAVVDYVLKHKDFINPYAILVNLAKGFAPDRLTIAESLAKHTNYDVCTMKGPTFARELMNQMPTAFTIATNNPVNIKFFEDIFKDSPVFIDSTNDIRGVEILSILKNIYAIIVGIVDANFNSPNLRSMVLTRAFAEMKNILKIYGGREETMFNYCGIGDFTLTALNDLSRNRTLGLLIGKGFFTENISDKVVLEGKIAVNVICNDLEERNTDKKIYQIMLELKKVFDGNYDVSAFVNQLLRNF